MVKGIETFKTYFKEYADEYVLIGGAACDILFDNSDASLDSALQQIKNFPK